MSTSTGIDKAALEKAATDLEGLVPDETMKEFEKLKDIQLEAGDPAFDAAQWLEHVLIDRRHGMIEHVKNLQFVFGNLATTLRSISSIVGEKDEDGAKALDGQATEKINEWITQSLNHELPPAAPTGSGRKSDYNSKDKGNPEGAFALFDIDGADKKPKEPVVINVPLPSDKGKLPSADKLLDEYGSIIGEANKGDGPDINEDFVFLSEKVTNTSTDPEDDVPNGAPPPDDSPPDDSPPDDPPPPPGSMAEQYPDEKLNQHGRPVDGKWGPGTGPRV